MSLKFFLSYRIGYWVFIILLAFFSGFITYNVQAAISSKETANIEGNFVNLSEADGGESSCSTVFLWWNEDDRIKLDWVSTYYDIPYFVQWHVSQCHWLDIYTPEWFSWNLKYPVMVYIHGGGWRLGDKLNAQEYRPKAFVQNDMIFVSINYDLYSPESPVSGHPNQITDIAAAYAWVIDSIQKFWWDPDRVYIMGHSAWAHLAALLATKKIYLEKYKKSVSDIKGVIALDGAWYDIPKIISLRSKRDNKSKELYIPIFWDTIKKQGLASPVNYISKDTPPFFFIQSKSEKTSASVVAKSMLEKLHMNGIRAEIIINKNEDHAAVNKTFAKPNDPNRKFEKSMCFLGLPIIFSPSSVLLTENNSNKIPMTGWKETSWKTVCDELEQTQDRSLSKKYFLKNEIWEFMRSFSDYFIIFW